MLNVYSLTITNSWMYVLLNCIMKLEYIFRLVSYCLMD